ncbi:MAG: 30S ribosomal protein S1 [Chloracidobacterium sp.]|nr:30S ribosomal protein S1 [Chloracidobacterium sp.]
MVNEVTSEAEETKTGASSANQEPTTQDAAAASPTQAPEAATTATEEAAPSGEVDFGAILEQFEQEQTAFHAGDLVEGKVVGVSDHGALIDFGYKSEGLISSEELAASSEELTVGETIEVVIKTLPGGDAPPTLSRSDAKLRKVWNDLEEAFKNETPVVAKAVDKTKGGLKLDLNGIEAFMPGSQVDSRPARSLDAYIGQDIEAKIIKFSRRRNNIVLSRKVLTDVLINEQKDKTLASIDVGYVVDGTIKNLTEYGAFVDIGGIDGLLHVTDMSWGRIGNPADHFKVNDHLQVKVLKLDREKEKISLGYKQLLPDPWSTVVEMYPVNTKLNGKVSSVTEYGVFVELEPGVEGLVHVSEISWSKRGSNPKKMFHKGDSVEVQVLGVDTVDKRISLGMKQLQDNPWHNIEDRYPVGTKIRGKVRNITDFGAFVEVEDGIDGLVHVSDITWAKKLKHPKDLLKKDQEVDAVVTHIDAPGQRLSLSMKDLTPSAWEGFVATHKPGDVVRGKVSRFTSFGIFVELGEGLEGLCHISELSDERVENAESVASLGQEMDFKILRIENEEQKIGLSHRAVGKEDEPVVDTRVYSSEAKGGMASLGELANLMKGGAEEAKPEMTKEEREEAKKARKEKAKQEYEASLAKQEEESAAASDEAAAAETVSEPAAEEAVEAAAETPAEPAAEALAEETVEAAAETPAEPAAETPAEETVEAAAETPAEPTAETPAEEAVEAAAETPAEPAAETPAEETVEAAAETSDETTGTAEAVSAEPEAAAAETGEDAEANEETAEKTA